ncbi:lytic polysaccharide monooxygenase auxiliary activity family 9 protein [Streptomyces sp. NPDC060000]|uniref:lytic polysaccharide monooxygenase auxiliary activity family 9 protein n=1 Tax=Streptomyces sp. NPDC060000 TaxID=3347031 RepID=UPI0036A18843
MQSRHGAVSSPPSRAHLYLEDWQANGLEAGKFFPQTQAGLSDPFAPSDVVNAQPPEDRRIASAGKDFAASLDEVGRDWKKHPVTSGQNLEITWGFHAEHKTRRFNYFLTKNDWDPKQALTRAQFETKPFHSVQLTEQPYWEYPLATGNPTTHTMRLPERRVGHHVLLAVWEVADTGQAFYQVIDLQYT